MLWSITKSVYALKKQRSFTLPMVFAPLAFLLSVVLIFGDYEVFIVINQGIANPLLDFVFAYASPIFFSVFYFLTLVALYISRDNECIASGMISLLTGPLSYGIGSLMKLLIKRPRPFHVLSDVRIIGLWHTSSYSFPSTTTMLVIGFTLPILFEKHRIGIILFVLSYFIGFSVIYTGYHFPFDVAAGIILSLAITSITNRMKKPIATYLKQKKLICSD